VTAIAFEKSGVLVTFLRHPGALRAPLPSPAWAAATGAPSNRRNGSSAHKQMATADSRACDPAPSPPRGVAQ
jgi:hypothetical protein